jgi:ABC-type lipoprotein export system ATPase subunit
MTELLRLEQVYKWIGEGSDRVEILKGVSLTIRAGQFTAIMGTSGSGKSTLLNLIGLLDVPSSGSLSLLGKEVSHLAESELAVLRARTIGFIFQSFNLLGYLTARENIELPMAYTQHPSPSQKSTELLRRMNLEHRVNAYPPTLSGGERQRVAIARSLANEPALILADEPTGALDSRTGAQVMDLISQLNREGAAVILVTHDEAIARRAQNVLHMKDGQFI